MSQQINLFNPIFLKQKKYFSTVTMLQALALLAVGCVLLVMFAVYQTNLLTRDAAATSSQLAAAQAQLAKVMIEYAPQQRSAAVVQKIQASERELRGMQQVVDTLKQGDFGSTRGYSEYLRAFARQDMHGVWLTGLEIVGDKVSVQGRSLQPELVPRYMHGLKREAVLQGTSFETLEMQSPPEKTSGFIEFNLY